MFSRAAAMLLVMLLTTTTAWAEQSGNWIYTPYTNGTCVITEYESPSGEIADVTTLTIPKQLDDYWVVDVSDNVLSGFTSLQTLFFHSNAGIIHMPKVHSGTSFKEVTLVGTGETIANTLPASMTDIGNAFKGTGIKNLTMPGVTSIGASAFEGCNSLESVTFGQAAPIGVYGYESPFSKISSSCTVTYPGPMANWSAYNYQYSPNLVVNCSDGSCGWCGDGWDSNWTNDDLYKDNSCTYWTLGSDGHLTIDCLAQDIILDNYFSKQTVKTTNWDKSKVKSLRLERVYEFLYGGFPNLTSLSISKNVASIGIDYWNLDIPRLTTIVVDAENPIYDSRDGCNAVIETATNELILGGADSSIPSTVTSIGASAYQNRSGITSITIPSGVREIHISAFEECSDLSTVTLPSSLNSIGWYVFSNCNNLKDLYFDGSKTQWNSVTKGYEWNSHVSTAYTEHWRCTVTFDANGRDTAPDAQTGLWSNEAKATEPEVPIADGWRVMGWYTDAACTTPWNFDTDIVTDDMTLYAEWVAPCAVTTSASETSIDIPYGQEWTDIAVTLNSLTLGWFQNGTNPARIADAMAVTPLVGSGAGTSLTFTDSNAATLTARRGAGAHTNTGALSETLTAAGQSGTLWVHIPEEVWKNAAAGNYSTFLNYDAVFISNDPTPAENYTYSLGSGAQVTLSLTIPEAVTLSFDANDGTGTMDAVSGRKGFDMQLPVCTFTAPAGKDFLCWNTKADGTGTRYYVGSPYTFSENQTFYAEWGEGYVLDLTTTAMGESVVIPLRLSAQLTQLTGYFNNESDPMGLDLNLDGEKDLALVQTYDDVSGTMTASVTKLTSLTENYRFLLPAPSEEGEYGSVLIKFVSGNSAVEPATIELLFDDNGTYNSGQLLVLKDGQPHNLMLSGRTIYTDGKWNTLCLPFDIDNFSGTPLEGFTVKELDTETAYSGHVTGVEGTTLYLNFKDATRIEAGKPYIVKSNELAVHRYTATAGTAGIQEVISYDKLIDGNTSTVWNVAFSGSAYCEFHSYVPMLATSYTETTGSRTSTATAWTLQAKLNEEDEWTTIDTRGADGDALPSKIYVTKEFTIQNPGTYKYFRFEVTRISEDSGFALADLTLRGHATVVNPVFYGVTVTTATKEIANPFRMSYEDPEFITIAVPTDVVFTDGKFCGTYDPVDFTANDKSILFLGAANTLYWPNAAMTLGACRAYFQLADGVSASKLNLNFDSGEETGISEMRNEEGEMRNGNDEMSNGSAWFTLSGTRLSAQPTKPGLYIHGGRKVVIK